MPRHVGISCSASQRIALHAEAPAVSGPSVRLNARAPRCRPATQRLDAPIVHQQSETGAILESQRPKKRKITDATIFRAAYSIHSAKDSRPWRLNHVALHSTPTCNVSVNHRRGFVVGASRSVYRVVVGQVERGVALGAPLPPSPIRHNSPALPGISLGLLLLLLARD